LWVFKLTVAPPLLCGVVQKQRKKELLRVLTFLARKFPLRVDALAESEDVCDE
jgi:hypothetical protein